MSIKEQMVMSFKMQGKLWASHTLSAHVEDLYRTTLISHCFELFLFCPCMDSEPAC